ncbi:MAG: nucleotidyltransferase [Porphyromonadaceae bacterium CG2_30_38_12]|nr:MAG: nucleotidyltransferase [Porphyromonadaceae bacterium CG2_30_38_12]
MTDFETTYLERCVSTLEKAYSLLGTVRPEDIEYDMYRSACVKEFEIILEQCGKLLKKVLKPYFASSKAVDMLIFKDVFRHAALHSIINTESCERWMQYRDNRNSTAHDYGVGFAQDTLILLPQFIVDAKYIILAINNQNQ